MRRTPVELAIEYGETAERVLLMFLVGSIVVSAMLYMYLVANAAYATADRREFARETVSTEGELAYLEERYLSARAQVTLDGALSFGLSPADTVAYATLDERGNALSLEVR